MTRANTTGPKNGNWKGGRIRDRNGYILIWVGKEVTRSGYALEHRLVMEKKLGRKLKPEEVVHHKDEDVTNNRLSNLELKPGRREHLWDHHSKVNRTVYDILDDTKPMSTHQIALTLGWTKKRAKQVVDTLHAHRRILRVGRSLWIRR